MATSNPDIKGTRTEQNLVVSYLNESQSYARYTYYAQQADKENYFPIGCIFRETADNELHHAKVFFKMLRGGVINATVPTDAGIIGDTVANLKIAIQEEAEGGVKAYHEYARVAIEEGFPEIAAHFTAIAAAEQHHLDRFQRYLDMVNAGTVWKREKPIKWRCLVCGYVFEGTEPPRVCPGCDHPYQHYVPLCPED